MMLADVMMETGLIHSYSRLDNNNTNNNNNNKDDEGYMGRLKRSVLSESWAAVDYDSRHHHAYCEVSIFTTIYYLLSTIYYLLSTTAPTTHIHMQLMGLFRFCYLLLQVLIAKSQEEEGLPCLVYMSREKSLQRKHHYKAGNMNALIFNLSLSLSSSLCE